jgi:cyclopropane fatty-acyl-phospholipid synthase-like methyltransferase
LEPGTRVLGLGCGEGELLHFLRKNKGVTCTEIELHEDKVAICMAKGLTFGR